MGCIAVQYRAGTWLVVDTGTAPANLRGLHNMYTHGYGTGISRKVTLAATGTDFNFKILHWQADKGRCWYEAVHSHTGPPSSSQSVRANYQTITVCKYIHDAGRTQSTRPEPRGRLGCNNVIDVILSDGHHHTRSRNTAAQIGIYCLYMIHCSGGEYRIVCGLEPGMQRRRPPSLSDGMGTHGTARQP